MTHNNLARINKRYKHISKHHRNRYNRRLNNKLNAIVDPHTYITNPSSKTLTKQQNKILTLGLKYVPR